MGRVGGRDFLHKLNEGTLSFADLFRQHNEYRQFFPNLVFVFPGAADNSMFATTWV